MADISTPSSPPPDRIPDEVVARYQHEARDQVRTRASKLYRFRRSAGKALRDPYVWVDALAIFLWGVMALAVVGGLGYAAVQWPHIVLIVVLPIVGTFGLSFLIASARQGRRPTE